MLGAINNFFTQTNVYPIITAVPLTLTISILTFGTYGFIVQTYPDHSIYTHFSARYFNLF